MTLRREHLFLHTVLWTLHRDGTNVLYLFFFFNKSSCCHKAGMLHPWSTLSLFTMHYICRLFLALFFPSGISVVTSFQWVGEQFASRTSQAQNGFTKLPSALAFRLTNTLMGISDSWLYFHGGCNFLFSFGMLLIVLSDDAARQHYLQTGIHQYVNSKGN